MSKQIQLIVLIVSAFCLLPAMVVFAGSVPTEGPIVLGTDDLIEDEILLDQASGNAAGLADLSGTLNQRQQLMSEINRLHALLSRQPEQPRLWFDLGRLQQQLKNFSAARQSYQRALVYDADFVDARQALEAMERLGRWDLSLDGKFSSDREFLPGIERVVSRWEEWTVQLQAGRRLNSNRQLSVGVLNGVISQYSLIFHDYDFRLERRGVFLQLQTPLPGSLNATGRLRYEEFRNRGKGYYQLDGPTSLVTGYATLSRQFEKNWLSLSYSRERDPDPVYDSLNHRVALNIKAQELSGLSWGRALGKSLESVVSLYYERYGTSQPNQFNANLQLLWHPQRIPRLELSLGNGYYTEEKETISNLTGSWKQPLSSRTALELEYQLEYAQREGALLHQGGLRLSSRWGRHLQLALKTILGAEFGDDKDRFTQVSALLNWIF